MYAKNVWTDADEAKKDEIFAFSKEYMDFLTNGKTERMATKEAVAIAKKNGFKEQIGRAHV